MIYSRCVHLDLGRVAQWIIDAQLFDEAPISGATAIGGDNSVERRLLATATGQSESYGHEVLWKGSVGT